MTAHRPSRRLALGGLGAVAATPAAAVDPRRRPRPPPSKPEPVPIRLSRGLPWTTVEIDGREALPFGLNIGNQSYWCHPSVAEAAGYAISKDDQTRIEFKQVRVGGRLLDTDARCIVSRLFFEGLPFAGQVGVARYDPFLIDWDARQLVFNPAVPAGWTEVKVIQNAPNIGPVVEVMVDGEPAQLILSTTRPWGLELAAPYVKRRGLWDRYARRRNDVNADGAVVHQMAVMGRIELAGMAFEEVFARLYADETVYRYDHHAADGIIGVDLLRRMNLHVDRSGVNSRTKRTFLAPSAQPAGVQVDDRAGMVFKAYGSELQVARIDEAGPAFKAGVRVGDTLIDAEVEGRIEGLPYALTREAGTEVPLDILRGEARKRIVVTLEDRL